jgi:ribosome-associated toxin RatA of RatAB toxin-antitoxin module
MTSVENEIVIQADVERVYAIARAVEEFPEFMPDVKSVRVLERSEDGRRTVVEWVGLIPEFKQTVKWVEEDVWNDAEHTCQFRLVRGDFKEYSGLWRFTPTAGSEGRDDRSSPAPATRFESHVSYEYDIPLIGPLIKGVIRKKMQENVDRLLQAIKDRAEAG